MSVSKYNVENVREILQRDEYVLLSTEYKNSITNLNIKCPNGHGYSATFKNFLKGTRCPKCFGTPKNSLEKIQGTLSKHGYTLMSDVYVNNTTPIDMKCPNGHVVQNSYRDFTSGKRCWECNTSKRKELPHISAAFLKEGYQYLSGDYVNNKSELMVGCPFGHQYTTDWTRWVRGVRCGVCGGSRKKTLAEVNAVFGEFGYSATGRNTETSRSSTWYVKCPAGHRYSVSLYKFQAGARCKACSTIPVYGIENIRPIVGNTGYELLSTEYKGVKEKLQYKCPVGHVYETSWEAFNKGLRCHQCSPSYPKNTDEIRSIMGAEGFQLLSEYQNWSGKLEILCPKGHNYLASYSAFYNGHRCPVCASSIQEYEFMRFLDEMGVKYKFNDRQVIKPNELDFFVPELNIGIEMCGVYWHSELYKDKNYHKEKFDRCRERRVDLITVFEDEWLYRKEQVKGFVAAKLHRNTKVPARKCRIISVDTAPAKAFLNQNHIRGACNFTHAFGLLHNEELVEVMTFGPHHRKVTGNGLLLSRMCTRIGLTVVGGASKLFKYAASVVTADTISTFADLRHSQGLVYQKLGFRLVENLKPDYSYAKAQQRFSKQSLRKTDIEKLMVRTEHALRLEQGYYRIYDCGKSKYEWTRC